MINTGSRRILPGGREERVSDSWELFRNKWLPFVSWPHFEIHYPICTCSYCKTWSHDNKTHWQDKRFGLELPENKGKNSWRILYLRTKKRRFYLRWTLK